MALPNPKGNETRLDKNAINNVPVISGNTPNEGGSKTGDHLIDVKNSNIETSEKKITVSNIKLKTIPIVVNIEIDANKISITSIIFS